MSYVKAMKHSNNHKKNKFYQPILGMPFKENEHIESYTSIANRTATGYHVRLFDKETRKYIQISDNYDTEDEAIDFLETINNDLPTRIYSKEGMHISGW